MRNVILSILATGAIAAGCYSTKPISMEPNTISPGTQKTGWKLLFDGKTTNGWHSYLKTEPGSAWKVVDGAITLDVDAKKNGASGGDLVTNEEFENFELMLDWKISEGGNSGIIFSIHEDKKYNASYLTGPEMQVLDDDKHSDGKILKHNAGDLYDLKQSVKRATKPVGEWNEVRIIKNNGKLSFWLNGVETVKTVIGSPEWNEMVANSKFKSWEGFAKYPKGKIALQDHGDRVWYRNIKIKNL